MIYYLELITGELYIAAKGDDLWRSEPSMAHESMDWHNRCQILSLLPQSTPAPYLWLFDVHHAFAHPCVKDDLYQITTNPNQVIYWSEFNSRVSQQSLCCSCFTHSSTSPFSFSLAIPLSAGPLGALMSEALLRQLASATFAVGLAPLILLLWWLPLSIPASAQRNPSMCKYSCMMGTTRSYGTMLTLVVPFSKFMRSDRLHST